MTGCKIYHTSKFSFPFSGCLYFWSNRIRWQSDWGCSQWGHVWNNFQRAVNRRCCFWGKLTFSYVIGTNLLIHYRLFKWYGLSSIFKHILNGGKVDKSPFLSLRLSNHWIILQYDLKPWLLSPYLARSVFSNVSARLPLCFRANYQLSMFCQKWNMGCPSTTKANHYSATFIDICERVQSYAIHFNKKRVWLSTDADAKHCWKFLPRWIMLYKW